MFSVYELTSQLRRLWLVEPRPRRRQTLALCALPIVNCDNSVELK